VLAWPLASEKLIEKQSLLGTLKPTTWQFEVEGRIGGVFVCFARGKSGPGQAGDQAWAAARFPRLQRAALNPDPNF
jgi:deoxyribonuclease V